MSNNWGAVHLRAALFLEIAEGRAEFPYRQTPISLYEI
ncbi:hypothetical protein bcere0022_38590 [Bacillus cereus Rock3-44]|nr:hypothetical protein bcere0022_38590 [Bacillus cereus Rock3-44]